MIRIGSIALLALCALSPGLAAGAGGAPSGGGGGGFESAPRRSPEEIAESRYNAGLAHRDRAWKYEAEAAEAGSETKREKLLSKAQKQYAGAIKDFRRAIDKNPMHHAAYSSLGYALRRTGQLEEALEAYDQALSLRPTYAEAIEYRAEAYLGLGRLEEAKQAYVRLFVLERALADQLMRAMGTWLDERARQPNGVPRERLDAFATWLEERREIAAASARVSEGDAGRW